MQQDTKNKFAAILAAQQAKVNDIKPNSYKVTPDMQEIPQNIGFNPDTQKFVPLDNTLESYTKEERQTIEKLGTVECSDITINDLLNEPAKESDLILVDYSNKAFAIIGNTKPIKEKLMQLGGRFNYYLSCGAGWIFSKTRMDAVRIALNL